MSKNNKKYTYKIIFSYDGSRFCGSAKQPNMNCVQNMLDEALKTVGIFTPSIFASRTDKGVHAKCNVAKIESNYKLNEKFVIKKLNYVLNGIFIKNLIICEFEPRFDAKIRSYRYIISPKINAFNKAFLCHYEKNINLNLLKEAIKIYEGEHNFKEFCLSLDKDKNTIRTIHKTRIYTYKNMIIFNFFANGFLRGQIRLMMDFLLKINEGKLNLNDLKEQISGIKSHSRTLASPNGLYLKSISY
ncbi:tRNA pseudouridine(38-40) synthase TruA [Campylobacter sp. MG1]|uniref:tRNA pseudouridine(38-40) synthase TruA n=1 Tax=Campylobacter sp. MG1 TaxID=2976332 RepID=UPI00226D0F36|nr:tRNA pseudouridine(38-40) synthase TruA [Campylobacter sp. MG1]